MVCRLQSTKEKIEFIQVKGHSTYFESLSKKVIKNNCRKFQSAPKKIFEIAERHQRKFSRVHSRLFFIFALKKKFEETERHQRSFSRVHSKLFSVFEFKKNFEIVKQH